MTQEEIEIRKAAFIKLRESASLEARKAKFKRKAPMIKTTSHLNKILESFPVEHRAEIIEDISPFLAIPIN